MLSRQERASLVCSLLYLGKIFEDFPNQSRLINHNIAFVKVSFQKMKTFLFHQKQPIVCVCVCFPAGNFGVRFICNVLSEGWCGKWSILIDFSFATPPPNRHHPSSLSPARKVEELLMVFSTFPYQNRWNLSLRKCVRTA